MVDNVTSFIYKCSIYQEKYIHGKNTTLRILTFISIFKSFVQIEMNLINLLMIKMGSHKYVIVSTY